jgi:hypothetical protein
VALSLIAVVRLVSAQTAPGAPAAGSSAVSAPANPAGSPTGGRRVLPAGPATSIRVPTDDCGATTALQLDDLTIRPPARVQAATSLSDLEFSVCGTPGGVLVVPDGDALLSAADIAADADATACAESMREGTVSVLRVEVGATFCALQRAGTIPHPGGQTMGRLTVTGIGAGGVVTMAVLRWRT